MLVVDNFHVNISISIGTYTHFFSYVLKSYIGIVLSYCANEKNVYMFSYVFHNLCWFCAIKLIECQKIHLKYEIHNTA